MAKESNCPIKQTIYIQRISYTKLIINAHKAMIPPDAGKILAAAFETSDGLGEADELGWPLGVVVELFPDNMAVTRVHSSQPVKSTVPGMGLLLSNTTPGTAEIFFDGLNSGQSISLVDGSAFFAIAAHESIICSLRRYSAAVELHF